MNTCNTCIPPILGRFSCSQAHNLLACDQPDLKDNFSPIKKIRHFDPFWRDGPLTLEPRRVAEASEVHGLCGSVSGRSLINTQSLQSHVVQILHKCTVSAEPSPVEIYRGTLSDLSKSSTVQNSREDSRGGQIRVHSSLIAIGVRKRIYLTDTGPIFWDTKTRRKYDDWDHWL